MPINAAFLNVMVQSRSTLVYAMKRTQKANEIAQADPEISKSIKAAALAMYQDAKSAVAESDAIAAELGITYPA